VFISGQKKVTINSTIENSVLPTWNSEHGTKNNITMRFTLISIFALLLIATSCIQPKEDDTLPILGHRDVVEGDTVYHTIPDFSFINQDSNVVNNETFAGKAYVVDFFFISCPTICPKVKKQMLRLYDEFKEEPNLVLLSHTIDTKRDTVARLKNYARNLGVEAPRWHLVTGDESEIYDIADDYFSIAVKDPTAPGGFDHSGRLILVDKDRHVRAFCDGTDPESVDQFMEDIRKLLKEDYM
jgi:protein SCO1/2